MTDLALNGVSRAYFDTNAIIYFIEANIEFQSKVASLWYGLIDRNASVVTSEIGVAECFFGAFQQQKPLVEQAYERLFFHDEVFDIHPVNLTALIEAGRFGAGLGLKLLDAVHFHAAAMAKCDIFVTNDRRFRSSHGVRVVQIAEL